MNETITQYKFERISSQMTKKFGTIKKGHEDDYAFMLMPLEMNLIKANRIHKINNGRRVIEAIHVCLLMIDDYISQSECNPEFVSRLSSFVSKENEPYIKALLSGYDPFYNKEILPIAQAEYQLDVYEDLLEFLNVPVKCLLRIESSVAMWTKDFGITGYFDFLEGYLGKALKNDDKMDFTVALKSRKSSATPQIGE